MPRFDIFPRMVRSPVEICFGTSPSQAAKSRPFENTSPVPIAATVAGRLAFGFGITPKAALVSHSSFGASDSASARKMRRALGLIRERAPGLEIDGEMHADAALVQTIRDAAVPDSKLTGTANLLIMPNLDAANIAFNLLRAAADGLPIGPMLLGMTKPIHVVVPSVTARGIVNLSALAVMEAQAVSGAAGTKIR